VYQKYWHAWNPIPVYLFTAFYSIEIKGTVYRYFEVLVGIQLGILKRKHSFWLECKFQKYSLKKLWFNGETIISGIFIGCNDVNRILIIHVNSIPYGITESMSISQFLLHLLHFIPLLLGFHLIEIKDIFRYWLEVHWELWKIYVDWNSNSKVLFEQTLVQWRYNSNGDMDYRCNFFLLIIIPNSSFLDCTFSI